MMAVIPAQLRLASVSNRNIGQEAKFPVAVIYLRLGTAAWGRRMPSWWNSIVNRPAKSRASIFSAMAAPVS
jgi:hypothetical protein